MKKNVASQIIGVEMVSSATGAAYASAVTAYVCGDGGSQLPGGGTVTAVGNGYYKYAPTQAETNYDHIAFTFTGTGAVPVTVQVYTDYPQTGDAYARLGAPAGASIAADIAAIDSTLDGVSITFTGNVLTGGAAEIVQEADYNDTIGNTLIWTVTGLPTIPSDAVITLVANRGDYTFEAAGVYVSATQFKVPIDGSLTTAMLLPEGQYKMQVRVASATWGAGKEVPYVDSTLTVKRRVAGA